MIKVFVLDNYIILDNYWIYSDYLFFLFISNKICLILTFDINFIYYNIYMEID